MTRATTPISVELTFADGSVKHFKQSLGDSISMSQLDDKDNAFYTLILAPVANSQKDKI